jgi:hypothetical protein
MKPLGYLGWNDQDGLGHTGGIQPADVMNLARQLQALTVNDRRKLLLVIGMDRLRFDVFLRCCGTYPPSRVVWCLGNRLNRLLVGYIRVGQI